MARTGKQKKITASKAGSSSVQAPPTSPTTSRKQRTIKANRGITSVSSDAEEDSTAREEVDQLPGKKKKSKVGTTASSSPSWKQRLSAAKQKVLAPDSFDEMDDPIQDDDDDDELAESKIKGKPTLKRGAEVANDDDSITEDDEDFPAKGTGGVDTTMKGASSDEGKGEEVSASKTPGASHQKRKADEHDNEGTPDTTGLHINFVRLASERLRAWQAAISAAGCSREDHKAFTKYLAAEFQKEKLDRNAPPINSYEAVVAQEQMVLKGIDTYCTKSEAIRAKMAAKQHQNVFAFPIGDMQLELQVPIPSSKASTSTAAATSTASTSALNTTPNRAAAEAVAETATPAAALPALPSLLASDSATGAATSLSATASTPAAPAAKIVAATPTGPRAAEAAAAATSTGQTAAAAEAAAAAAAASIPVVPAAASTPTGPRAAEAAAATPVIPATRAAAAATTPSGQTAAEAAAAASTPTGPRAAEAAAATPVIPAAIEAAAASTPTDPTATAAAATASIPPAIDFQDDQDHSALTPKPSPKSARQAKVKVAEAPAAVSEPRSRVQPPQTKDDIFNAPSSVPAKTARMFQPQATPNKAREDTDEEENAVCIVVDGTDTSQYVQVTNRDMWTLDDGERLSRAIVDAKMLHEVMSFRSANPDMHIWLGNSVFSQQLHSSTDVIGDASLFAVDVNMALWPVFGKIGTMLVVIFSPRWSIATAVRRWEIKQQRLRKPVVVYSQEVAVPADSDSDSPAEEQASDSQSSGEPVPSDPSRKDIEKWLRDDTVIVLFDPTDDAKLNKHKSVFDRVKKFLLESAKLHVPDAIEIKSMKDLDFYCITASTPKGRNLADSEVDMLHICCSLLCNPAIFRETILPARDRRHSGWKVREMDGHRKVLQSEMQALKRHQNLAVKRAKAELAATPSSRSSSSRLRITRSATKATPTPRGGFEVVIER